MSAFPPMALLRPAGGVRVGLCLCMSVCEYECSPVWHELFRPLVLRCAGEPSGKRMARALDDADAKQKQKEVGKESDAEGEYLMRF